MSQLTETLKDIRAKRAAQRQYIQAADRFREMARDEREAGRDPEALEEISDALMAEARYEAAE